MAKQDDINSKNSRDSNYEQFNQAHDDDESELLEAVLHETVANSNAESLELIFSVARASNFADTTQIGAVEEVVRAIIAKRFGNIKFSSRLIKRISQTLIETPEATVKLERLWQEGRASG